ncbi:MAG: 30S ribosomal protein S1 [Anaerolineales bacterium]|jgi:small subunit ribosomal protein S1
MMTEDGSEIGWGGGAPPEMDESWWTALMGEEEKQASGEPESIVPEQDHKLLNQGNPEDWEWAEKLYKQDNTIDLLVVGYNRGGVLVEAQSLRGFVPISHLIGFEDAEGDGSRDEKLSKYIGQRLCLKVIELDPERGRLVLSQRAGLAEPGRRVEILSSLSEGDEVEGTVTNITSFGVFVDLGGVEGLIHVSELSWGRVGHPSDVACCGERLKVHVLSVDRANDRVALSLKELQPDPWEDVEERYKVGEIVEGCVTNVVKFGAFVGIDEGLEGLIHVSELGDGNFLHPRSVVDEGEQVRVRIIHIDAENRRLGLSLRQVPIDSENDIRESIEPSESFTPL